MICHWIKSKENKEKQHYFYTIKNGKFKIIDEELKEKEFCFVLNNYSDNLEELQKVLFCLKGY